MSQRFVQVFDSLFTSDGDHTAAATQGIEDQAYYAAQEAAALIADTHPQIMRRRLDERSRPTDL